MRYSFARSINRATAAAMAAMSIAAAAPQAQAQAYPTREVRLVIPVPPGIAGSAWAGRMLAEELTQRLKRPVVTEYRPGAGGLIGAEAVARAQPDGYTLLASTYGVGLFPVFVKTGFDGLKELTPVSGLMRHYGVVIGASQAPRTLDALINFAKANPGKLNVGMITNSASEANAARFLRATGIQGQLIPYSGPAAAMLAIRANEVHVYVSSPTGWGDHVRAGKASILTVAGPDRSVLFPDAPLVKSLGYDFVVPNWYAVFAPVGVPKAIISRLNTEIAEIMKQPKVLAQMRAEGSEPMNLNEEELQATLVRDHEIVKEGARAAGIRPQ